MDFMAVIFYTGTWNEVNIWNIEWGWCYRKFFYRTVIFFSFCYSFCYLAFGLSPFAHFLSFFSCVLFFFFCDDEISIGNSVLFTICIWVCYFCCCFSSLLFPYAFFVTRTPYYFFLHCCYCCSAVCICVCVLQVFWGRKQKQSYVHNNLRFSFCLRCYLHVQTRAFSGENMHESRKETLLCIRSMGERLKEQVEWQT